VDEVSELSLLQRAAQIIEDKKGEGVVAIDLTDVSIPTSYFLIAEADNPVHAKALVTALRESLPERPYRTEGLSERRWVILDYGDVVIHIFEREARSFYDIESLWADHLMPLPARAEAPRSDGGG
jgi:ribosome-associated protein